MPLRFLSRIIMATKEIMKYDIENLTPAPLNQKDILDDLLFEQIFDYGEYMGGERMKPHIALGFIHDIPCMIEWNYNSHYIMVTPMKIQNNVSWTAEILVLRLTQYNDEPDCQTICNATELAGDQLKIQAAYYYKPE